MIRKNLILIIAFILGMIFRPFSKSDPRLLVALEKHEPLIHFALVCGAKSCPPIKTYSADDVMNQVSGRYLFYNYSLLKISLQSIFLFVLLHKFLNLENLESHRVFGTSFANNYFNFDFAQTLCISLRTKI